MVCAAADVLLIVPALRSVKVPLLEPTGALEEPASTSVAPASLTKVGVPVKNRLSSPPSVSVPLLCQRRSPSRRSCAPATGNSTVEAPCVRSTPVPARPAKLPAVVKAPVTVTVPEPASVALCRLRLFSVMSLFSPRVPALSARSLVPSESGRPGEPRFSVPPVST
jgi:hypothetical protein